MKSAVLMLAAIATLAACDHKIQKTELPLLDKAAFETTVNGKQVALYTLTNTKGAVVQITNYGARMVALWVPDRDGVMRDVLLGYDSIEAVIADNSSAGPVVGRYGNRIAAGRFSLDGSEYQLATNNGQNHLHGGPNGWAKQVWNARQEEDNRVVMTLTSPDGDENYPGTVTIEVAFTLSDDNAVRLDYSATTDAPTVLNPTSHPYFNLHGTTKETILSHVMTIHADAFTPTDAGMIPTGEIRDVEDSPLDFRSPTTVGERIDADYEPLRFGRGYDHNWVLNNTPGRDGLWHAAELYEPATGIVLDVYTDQPAIQIYTGNALGPADGAKYGEPHRRRTGIALETQHFPDSPNHPEFPSTVLRPGEVYTQHTVYAFSTR